MDHSPLLSSLAIAMTLVFVAIPIYYLWKLVASFRKSLDSHWPPVACLGLWLLQWPFAFLHAAGCMGGGCGGAAVTMVEAIFLMAYNLAPAYWLWRRGRKRLHTDSPPSG
jgi:hypothetical protein